MVYENTPVLQDYAGKTHHFVDYCPFSASYFKKSRDGPKFKAFQCLRHTWYKTIQLEEVYAFFVWHCFFSITSWNGSFFLQFECEIG